MSPSNLPSPPSPTNHMTPSPPDLDDDPFLSPKLNTTTYTLLSPPTGEPSIYTNGILGRSTSQGKKTPRLPSKTGTARSLTVTKSRPAEGMTFTSIGMAGSRGTSTTGARIIATSAEVIAIPKRISSLYHLSVVPDVTLPALRSTSGSRSRSVSTVTRSSTASYGSVVRKDTNPNYQDLEFGEGWDSSKEKEDPNDEDELTYTPRGSAQILRHHPSLSTELTISTQATPRVRPISYLHELELPQHSPISPLQLSSPSPTLPISPLRSSSAPSRPREQGDDDLDLGLHENITLRKHRNKHNGRSRRVHFSPSGPNALPDNTTPPLHPLRHRRHTSLDLYHQSLSGEAITFSDESKPEPPPKQDGLKRSKTTAGSNTTRPSIPTRSKSVKSKMASLGTGLGMSTKTARETRQQDRSEVEDYPEGYRFEIHDSERQYLDLMTTVAPSATTVTPAAATTVATPVNESIAGTRLDTILETNVADEAEQEQATTPAIAENTHKKQQSTSWFRRSNAQSKKVVQDPAVATTKKNPFAKISSTLKSFFTSKSAKKAALQADMIASGINARDDSPLTIEEVELEPEPLGRSSLDDMLEAGGYEVFSTERAKKGAEMEVHINEFWGGDMVIEYNLETEEGKRIAGNLWRGEMW